MKSKFFFLCYVMTVFSLISLGQSKGHNNAFKLIGNIGGSPFGIAYLHYKISGEDVNDSCLLRDGRFYFRGNISDPTWAILKFTSNTKIHDEDNAIDFFLEPGKIIVTGEYSHFKEIKISGSQSQKEYKLLEAKLKPELRKSAWTESAYLKTKKQYFIAQKEHDERKSDSLSDRLDSISAQLAPSSSRISYLTREFIFSHPNSYVSAFELSIYKSRWPLDTISRLYNNLNPDIQDSQYGRVVKEMINSIKDYSSGKMAQNFTARSFDGHVIHLFDFKGKYVLLDFWASWCVPCREGNPHLIQIFKKYHNQGLSIVGISVDINPENWKEAIKKDGIDIWYNILSGEKKVNAKLDDSQSIGKKYGVHVFPTKILIDKKGMIIDRYQGTESEAALDQKLSEIFDQ